MSVCKRRLVIMHMVAIIVIMSRVTFSYPQPSNFLVTRQEQMAVKVSEHKN